MVDHEIDELAGFRADLVVHLLRGFDHERIVARGLCVAVREDHFFVIAHDVVEAEALCLRLIELPAQGDKERAHLLTEGRDLLLAVIRAALLEIADGDVVLVAEVFAHLVADFNQLVPDLLQPRLVAFIEFGIRLDGSGAHRAAWMLEVFLQAVEVQRLAVELDLGRGHDLLILVGQTALLLAQRNVFLAVQLLLQIHGDEILPAEFPLDIRAEGAGRDGLAERDLRAAERGQRVLQVLDLLLIKFVARVERVADVRNGILREQLAGLAVDLEHQRAQRVIALRLLGRRLPLGELCTPRFQIGAFVLQR